MQQTCTQCGTEFTLSDAELSLLKQIAPTFSGKTFEVPPPQDCSQCRFRQRLIWRPELHLFKRKSDKSGTELLCWVPPEAPCKVYSPEEWWADDWDPLSYGRDFDFSRSFFEQFVELIAEVPIVSLSVGGENINSNYVNAVSWVKNCYLLGAANHNEDCYYGNYVNRCNSCIDNCFLEDSELCYDCIDCSHCYNLTYSQQCNNCSDSYFLFACRGCKNCFGCVNLTDKQYHYLNAQLTKEEYEQKLAQAELHRKSRVEEAKRFFLKHKLKYPHKHMVGEMNENVTGNMIMRSRNCSNCYEVTDSEDCYNCSWYNKGKNCMDLYAWGFSGEENYFCTEVGDDSRRVLLSVTQYNCSNSLYSFHCRSSSDIFGCVSMRRAQYCIFNKQYSKDEYEQLAAKIIKHMQNTGEWGKFFPYSVSPMAYNHTIANDYFPLTKEDAIKLGAKWGQEEQPEKGEDLDLEDSIHDVSEDVCDKTFTCPDSGKAHRIIPQEFRMLKVQHIPVPTKHWFIRHLERFSKRNPRKLWKRSCDKCSKEIETSYSPDRPEIVYCESCYLEEVY